MTARCIVLSHARQALALLAHALLAPALLAPVAFMAGSEVSAQALRRPEPPSGQGGSAAPPLVVPDRNPDRGAGLPGPVVWDGASLTLSAPLRLGDPSANNYQLSGRRSLSGSYRDFNASLLDVTSDTASVPGFINYFTSQAVIQPRNTGTATGGRQAVYGLVTQENPTSAGNLNRNYVGVSGGVFANSHDTGSYAYDGRRLTGSPKGAYFGGGFQATASRGATGLLNVTGAEFNVSAATGSQVLIKTGVQISDLASNAVAGDRVDAAVGVSSQGGIGFRDGLLLDDFSGQFPIRPGVGGHIVRATRAGATVFSVDSDQGVIRSGFLAGASAGRALYANELGQIYAAPSDGRLKDGIAPILPADALDRVMRMRPITFSWADPAMYGRGRDLGFVAQDFKGVLPEAVREGRDGSMTIDYAKLTAVLAAALQEVKAENDALKRRLDKLERAPEAR